MVGGGIAFAVSAAAVGLAPEFWTLLAALLIGNPATGAFVSLAQATLMDLQPRERVRNMAAGRSSARSGTSPGRSCSQRRSGSAPAGEASRSALRSARFHS